MNNHAWICQNYNLPSLLQVLAIRQLRHNKVEKRRTEIRETPRRIGKETGQYR